MEIIPAILEKDIKSAKEKINLLKNITKNFQIDICDGKLTKSKTFFEGKDFKKFIAKNNLNLEVHLMVKDPYKFLDYWKDTGIKKIIFHFESFINLRKKVRVYAINNLINNIKKYKITPGIAFFYKTDIIFLKDFSKKINLCLLLSIEKPGYQGQKFKKGIFVKIKTLRQIFPNVKIEIDGGVNFQNIKKLKELKIDYTAIGSSIWKGDPIKNFLKFKKILNESL